MIEDSISCSPGNNGKKSRSRRFHKNPKRKLEQNSMTPIVCKEPSNLDALYEESTLSETLNSTYQFEFFNPFENEKLLAAADRPEASTSSRRLQNLTSKGFIRLESKQFEHENNLMKPPECSTRLRSAVTQKSPHVLGAETQFGITESEFVRFCDDVESDILVQSPSNAKYHPIGEVIEVDVGIKTPPRAMSVVEEILKDFCGSPTESEIEETTTPNSGPKFLKETKSIVDEILEDFCGSPFSDCSPKQNSEDSTPIFRFKSQAIRTYGGLRKKRLVRRNIATDLNVFTPRDDGNTSDSSSGLSVQEDLSQSVVPQLDTVDLNNSVKLCENLLNLSSYFSQLSSPLSKKNNSPPAVVEDRKKSKNLRLGAIVEEIIKLKSKSLQINWSKCEQEFRGFSDYENDSHESTLQELLEDEDDVLQQINCDSLCYEKIEPKTSLTHMESDLEKTLRNASAVIENVRALMLSEPDFNEKPEDSRSIYQPDYNIHGHTQSKGSPSVSFKDEQLFDEIDIWNDNECLLNYKTQKPHPKHVESDLFDDRSDKNKEIYHKHDSETEHSTIQPSKSLTSHRYGQRYEKITDPCSSASLKLSKDTNQFIKISSRENFKANSTNVSDCKNEGKEDINAIDAFPKNNSNYPYEKHTTNEGLSDDKSFFKSSACGFVGFATASKKPILISDTAKRKANEFLSKFEQQDAEERIDINESDFSACKKPVDAIPQSVTNRKSDVTPENSSPKNSFVGFSTASKRPISISNKAKQKADDILKKFEQDEQEKPIPETNYVTSSKNVDNKRQQDKSPSVNKVEDNLKVCGFVGFSTASEKPIAISLEAKRKADEILKKFEQVEQIEEETNDKLTQRHPNEVSEEVRRKAQELLLDIEFFEEAFEDELKDIEEVLPVSQVQKHFSQSVEAPSSLQLPPQSSKEQICNGFKTASKKSIHISKEARRRAENFMKETYHEELPQEFLNCIETEINEVNLLSKNPVPNAMGIVEQVDGAIRSPEHHLDDVLKTDADLMHATNGSEPKNKCSFHVSDERMTDHRQFDPAFKRLREKNEDCFKDTHFQTEENDKIQNIRTRKRKHSEGLELEKSFSSLVSPRRLSCGERTPLNRIENGLLGKSSTLISRKNLLSLSKRKKSDSPGQNCELLINGPKTPEKVEHLSNSHNIASSTPNIKGFFDLVSTSTPRLVRNDSTNNTNQKPSKDTIDSDFRQIQWEDSNNSFRINRTSCVDEVNVTFSEVSPSPKQRIERLKMYGEPPPISPILMLNKCRPSGLRRGRSLMKP